MYLKMLLLFLSQVRVDVLLLDSPPSWESVQPNVMEPMARWVQETVKWMGQAHLQALLKSLPAFFYTWLLNHCITGICYFFPLGFIRILILIEVAAEKQKQVILKKSTPPLTKQNHASWDILENQIWDSWRTSKSAKSPTPRAALCSQTDFSHPSQKMYCSSPLHWNNNAPHSSHTGDGREGTGLTSHRQMSDPTIYMEVEVILTPLHHFKDCWAHNHFKKHKARKWRTKGNHCKGPGINLQQTQFLPSRQKAAVSTEMADRGGNQMISFVQSDSKGLKWKVARGKKECAGMVKRLKYPWSSFIATMLLRPRNIADSEKSAPSGIMRAERQENASWVMALER